MKCQLIRKLLALSFLLNLIGSVISHASAGGTSTKRYVRRRNDRGRKATTGALLGGALGAGLGGAIGGGRGAAVGAVTGVAAGATIGASRDDGYEEYEVIEEPYEPSREYEAPPDVEEVEYIED